MRIVIISDIHDNAVNLDRCLEWCRDNDIEQLICCGDVTNNETLARLSQGFTGQIHLVRGNMEVYDDRELAKFANIVYYGTRGRIKLDNYYAGFCHEPFLIDEVLALGECSLIFYGHTHKPWIEKRGNMTEVNPGTLGGVFQKASFAFWDTVSGRLELKIMDSL